MTSRWQRIGGLVATILGLWLGVDVGDASAGFFRVHTCNRPDYQLALGPTIRPTPGASGWLYEQHNAGGVLQDDCPNGGPFKFWLEAGVKLRAGDFLGAVWTAAPNTRLVGFSLRWIAGLDNSPLLGEGTSEVTLTTDRETLVQARNQWGTPANSGAANLLTGALMDASRFEMRFTCLDACTSRQTSWMRGWVSHACLTSETIPRLPEG